MRYPHFLCLHRFPGQEFLPATVLNGTDEIFRTYYHQKGEKTMSHNIQHYDYPENVDQKKVFRDLANYVRHEAWQEGGH